MRGYSIRTVHCRRLEYGTTYRMLVQLSIVVLCFLPMAYVQFHAEDHNTDIMVLSLALFAMFARLDITKQIILKQITQWNNGANVRSTIRRCNAFSININTWRAKNYRHECTGWWE